MDICVDICEITGWEIEVKMGQVLEALSCPVDNPAYEEMVAEYRKIQAQIPELVHPVGVLGLTSLPACLETEEYRAGTPVVYGVLSVGRYLEEESSRQFQEGNYVQGMLWDAAANVALFSMEVRMQEALREFSRTHEKGVDRRLEAPHDIPMEVQREAWMALELERRYGIRITKGCMLDPVKTSCQVFVLTKDQNRFAAGHDCRKCQNVTCRYRQIPEEDE